MTPPTTPSTISGADADARCWRAPHSNTQRWPFVRSVAESGVLGGSTAFCFVASERFLPGTYTWPKSGVVVPGLARVTA